MKRKFLALFLILVLALGLTACKDNSKEAETKVGDEKLIVSMGTNNPYGFLNDEEKPDGFVVDTWKEIGKRSGINIEFQYFDGMDAHYGSIDSGKVDVLGIQTAITDAIKDKYDFSDRYAYNIIRMVSLKDKDYESLADLAGKKICIAPGKLSEFFEAYNSENPDKKIELVTTEGNIYEELDLGRFEAFPMTIMSFEKMQREGKAEPYKMFGEAVITEENVFPINKSVSKDTQEKINKAIQDMLSDGTLAKISEKWYNRDVTKPFEE
ncbi:transporter substrate-binding domain-containing protein [Fenollaria timonensis]|uniref:transporter substrate-binding domain-containing protein n=1 Tax=Fenollaria timonensis TaxID=1723384 RepID=UPI0026F17C0E|nr:transporter substrate-binding domain-containing protein [Fenollaria timonensis]